MRTLALLLLVAGITSAQPRSRYLDIQKFRGTFEYRLSQSGTEFGLKYNVVANAKATFTLERTTARTPTWQGLMTESSSSISYTATETTTPICSASTNWSSAGPLQQGASPERYDVQISMFADTWGFSVARFFGPSTTANLVTTCSNGTSRTQPFSARLDILNNISSLSFPDSGTSLKISGKFPNPGTMGPLSAETHTWEVIVNIEPFTDDVELQITSDAFQKWRPTAKPDGDNAGDPIEITATVVRVSDGQPAPLDVERFEWELINTSQEPGIAINWPPSASDNNFDMKFKPANGQVPDNEKAQKMSRIVRNEAIDKATIVPSDWGAWSTLRVKAILRDRRELIGKLKGTSENDLRLPRRKLGSFVADVVKEDWKLDKSDTADDDPLAAGAQSGNGDGLTLYEEYRGFLVQGTWSMGDPQKQEFFAVNDLNGDGEAALNYFKLLTGLNVLIIKDDEYSPKRVVNANYSSSPHRVDQHGVWFTKAQGGELNPGEGGRSIGGPGTPGLIEKVIINPNIAPRPVPAAITNYTVAAIVHEAMHSVNVYHHGETDRTLNWVSNNGVLMEDGVPITVQDEAGNDITARLEASARKGNNERNLGVKGGQHSGDDDCVMRYDIAETYIDDKNPSIRRMFYGYEKVSSSLCSRKEGSGVNGKNHNPQSRYGDATVGDCKSQILVNDAISAPKR